MVHATIDPLLISEMTIASLGRAMKTEESMG